MIFRSYKAIHILLLAVSILLVSCQSNTVFPPATAQVLPSEKTPLAATQAATTHTPSATKNPGVPDSAALKGKTVVFWHPWSADLAKQVDEAAAEFNKKNEWGIQVQVKSLYGAGGLYDAVEAGVKAEPQDLPQVIAATSDQLAEWSANKIPLVDLNKYIQDAQVGLNSADLKSYQAAFLKQDQSGNQQLGLPALRTGQVIFYNQTWAKELGFQTVPKTPEEFKQQACAAAKANNDTLNKDITGTGGWLVDSDALTTLSWMSAFGAKAIPAAEGQPYTFESKEAENAVSFLRGMLDQGCAWTGLNPLPYTYFSQRMALFYSGSLDNMPLQKHYQDQAGSKDQWTVLPFPGEDGKSLVYASGYSYALLTAKDLQTQLAGWLFIKWMEQPDVAIKLLKAAPSIPVNDKFTEQIGSDKNAYPWQMLLPLSESVQPAPSLSTWRVVRRLFEDASWQIYRLPVEGLDKVLPQTLPQLDAAVKEAIK